MEAITETTIKFDLFCRDEWILWEESGGRARKEKDSYPVTN